MHHQVIYDDVLFSRRNSPGKYERWTTMAATTITKHDLVWSPMFFFLVLLLVTHFQFIAIVVNFVIHGHYLALEQTIIHHLDGESASLRVYRLYICLSNLITRFFNSISKQLSTQQFIAIEQSGYEIFFFKKISNIKCKQFKPSNESRWMPAKEKETTTKNWPSKNCMHMD